MTTKMITETEFDKWLYQKAQEEEFQVPESFHNRLNDLVQDLVADPAYPLQEEKKRSAIPAAIWVALAIAAATVTAKAAIDKLQERMQSIPDSEIDKNVSELESAALESDEFSREFSEQEKQRFEELLDRYKHGLQFPEGELIVVKTTDEAIGEGLFFVTKSRLFLLPERTLTDEELLQIIDFTYKRDYSLSEVDSSKEEHTWEAGPVTEEEAVQIAGALLEMLSNVKVEECEKKIESTDGAIWILFNKVNFDCNIRIKGSTGQVIAFEIEVPKVRDTEMLIDESLYKRKYKEIYQILVSQIGLIDPLEKSFCRYGEKEIDSTLYGNINYYFEVNQQYYIFQYNAIEDQIQAMTITEKESYDILLEINNGVLKERFGVESKRIDFLSSDTKD